MTDQLPGVVVHLHEGRLTGPFDLLRSDMTQVRLDGRVMLCVVADIVTPLNITTTKDGDNKAKWTFKAVDVALVRDGGMQERLSQALNMIAVDDIDDEDVVDIAPPPTHEGVYDEEGAFLGIEPVEDYTPSGPAPNAPKPPPDETPQRDAPPERRFSPVTVNDPNFDDNGSPVETVETFGKPIRHKDPHLDRFLGERVAS